MAKKENKYEGYGISTQSIHTGTDYDEETGAVRRPLHMANSYKLPDDLAQVNYSSTDLLMYTRNGNANQHWLEEKIAALHEADDAIVLASGVAALHALFWTLLKSGDRVVYPKVSYMAVYRMFHELFNNKFGVETVMVDMTDLEEVNAAITPAPFSSAAIFRQQSRIHAARGQNLWRQIHSAFPETTARKPVPHSPP